MPRKQAGKSDDVEKGIRRAYSESLERQIQAAMEAPDTRTLQQREMLVTCVGLLLAASMFLHRLLPG